MNNIESARNAKGMSQKELAITLNVSQPTVSNWEADRKQPVGKNLLALSDVLDVPVDYILGRTNNPTATTNPPQVLDSTIERTQKKAPHEEGHSDIPIDERVEQLLSGLTDTSDGTLMLDGEAATPEAIESLRGALKQAVETARAVNRARKKE